MIFRKLSVWLRQKLFAWKVRKVLREMGLLHSEISNNRKPKLISPLEECEKQWNDFCRPKDCRKD